MYVSGFYRRTLIRCVVGHFGPYLEKKGCGEKKKFYLTKFCLSHKDDALNAYPRCESF